MQSEHRDRGRQGRPPHQSRRLGPAPFRTAIAVAGVTWGGVVMFAHGAQKMLGWFGGQGYEATVAGMGGAFGLPAAVVTLVIVAELFGALGLIFGFLTRLSAIGIAAVMVGAIALVHWEH